MAKVIIIDDDPRICKMLERTVKRMGHLARFATTIREGMAAIQSESFDVVLLDVQMPDGSGLSTLKSIKKIPNPPEVIVITGFGDAEGAETAFRSGAWDYIAKPIYPNKIMAPLDRVFQHREAARKIISKKSPLRLEGIIGTSPEMQKCFALLEKAADSDANILVSGETGTGKELFSKAIHNNSVRSERGFIVVDCAALPEHLVESTLFGHKKGAFTGADSDFDGLVRQADKGTLFLDEVGELPLSVQKSFLRLLQERKFRPVGGKNEVASDFRLISATNRNLNSMVEKGKFRNDLLFRIRTLSIELPPLRDHIEDLPEITAHYVQKLSSVYNLGEKAVSSEFLDILSAYSFPGNVRELVGIIESALLSARNDQMLLPIHLPTPIRVSSVEKTGALPSKTPAERKKAESGEKIELPAFKEMMNEAEKNYLKELIRVTRGEIRRACEIASLSRSRLYALLKKHDISRKWDVPTSGNGQDS